MANIAVLTYLDTNPTIADAIWPVVSTLMLTTVGTTPYNMNSFGAEGVYTEPTIGQIWPR